MKKICTLLFLLSTFQVILFAQISTQFTNFIQGGVNSAEFTTNNFKCIGVGKGNLVWAGTQYGGLYMYNDTFNIWRKSTKLTNVFINDIKADADSGIWIAQSGTASVGGNSNIAGGVNYFPVNSDISMNFYSVAGTTTSADLLSRNVRSLYVDGSFSAVRGQLPRVWAAQGTYITSFNTRRGGLSIGLNPFATYFTNYASGYATGTSATPISEAVGGNSQEVWIAARQNNGGSQILRYKPNGSYIGFHGTADTSLFLNGFTAQAIHFDVAGNRWIGLKAGGLIIKTPTGWLSMNAGSLIPPGTQINFNAITSDEFGNVYIGTSSGLLEYLSPDYNASSSPDYVPSYNLFTTTHGLPNNNVTGLAYDKKNGKVLITSSGGVTFMNKREPFIKGVVFDVFTSIDSLNPYSGLQKKPLSSGVRVKLLKNGVEEEVTQPDANGIFELKEALDNEIYSVEVRYLKNGRAITYIYNNVRNHTLMEPSLIPDSLIGEIKAFKDKMERRCFSAKVYFGIDLKLNLFCTDAFKTGSYDAAYEKFYEAGGISADHKKRVDNLANYYASMATVYQLGGHATDLSIDAVSNLFDAVESMRGFVEFGYGLKKPGNVDPLEQIGEEVVSGLVSAVKLLKDGLILALTKSSAFIKDPAAKAMFDRCVTSLNEVADLAIEAIENGRNQAILKVLLDNMKKIIAVGVAIDYYKESYAQDRHEFFVPASSLSAYSNESDFTYAVTFDNLFNPGSNSIAKYAKDTLDQRKATITSLTNLAKYADMASNALDAATALALIPGGQIAGTIAKALSFAAKGTKTAALTGAMLQGATGAGEISTLSDKILPKAGFQRGPAVTPNGILNISQNAPDSLVARKNRYNQRLSELQAIYTAPTYDAVAFGNKRRQFKIDDSLYSSSMRSTLNALWASTDTAIVIVPGFTNRLNRVIDSFVTLQYTLRQSLYFQNLAYIYESNKTIYAGGLDSVSNEIKIANDSAVNGIAQLITDINNYSIGARAYLVQEGYQVNHSRVPGSTGTVAYTFRNYGGEVQNNVSFKISQPAAGYIITSADSVNVGTIQPGEVKQVTYTFQSPMHDSIGNYTIHVKAANGSYKDVYGAFYVVDPNKFYSIKDGNWNDPATWSNNQVPTNSNSVHISHTVTVTANTSCKPVTITYPGNVIVNTGKILNIVK